MNVLRIHPNDDVAVALVNLAAGQTIRVGETAIRLADTIPAGHKLALRDIPSGAPVRKYGFPIGQAKIRIPQGHWVHSHNLQTALTGRLDFPYEPAFTEPTPPSDRLTFDGYERPDGQVGIRNELWIIPTVGCVNRTARNLAETMARELPEGLDGVYAYEHPYGCSQLGQDHLTTQKILAGLVRHPNAGGVLVLGLGCENNQVGDFRKVVGDTDPENLRYLVAQECEDEFEAGLTLLRELATSASRAIRRPMPLSALRVGLKCGGSDAFSGLTANPLLGAFSDRLIAGGGGSALTEIPEMFGAERVILNRCRTPELFERGLKLVNDFRDYYTAHGQPVSENPSPGNLAGGITTLEDKSLGCVQKGGSSPVVDIVTYGQQLTQSGLAIVEGPGNDAVAVTNLAAAGCQLVLFTTGRGNPLGGPVPTLKVATNSDLAGRKPHWIDFNAGELLEGTPMDQLAEQMLELVLQVASGLIHTCNERHGYREIAIFKSGVTL